MNARALIEAESPKGAIQRAKGKEFAPGSDRPGTIWPGRQYFLNIASVNEPWDKGEFCPVLIIEGNKMDCMDGLYGLIDDIAKATNYSGEAEREDEHSAEMGKYTIPIWKAVECGVTAGYADGAAGPKKWRIVYDPNHNTNWNTSVLVPVIAGQAYGDAMPNED